MHAFFLFKGIVKGGNVFETAFHGNGFHCFFLLFSGEFFNKKCNAVAIDKISEILEAEIKSKETPAPPPVAPDPKPENLSPPVKTVDLEVAKALIQNLITRARENA